MSNSAFSDTLLPGETLLAVLEAPGVGSTSEDLWWQVALTRDRVLINKLVRPKKGKAWTTAGRLSGVRQGVTLTRFPRTPQMDARLSIDGCGERVALCEVDTEQTYAAFTSFLNAWGGVIGGPQIPPGWSSKNLEETPVEDNRVLYYVIGGMVAFMVLCCGCGVASAILRAIVAKL